MADLAVPPVPISVPSDPARLDAAPAIVPARPRFKRLVVFTGKLS
jgi:hypothetical protein